jgi:hypothetical protein
VCMFCFTFGEVKIDFRGIKLILTSFNVKPQFGVLSLLLIFSIKFICLTHFYINISKYINHFMFNLLLVGIN